MKKTIRIVNYAVNGTGVGHLTRLIAISRWIRRYAERLNTHAEVVFLTSSEADGLLFSERFASFKIPSKTAVAETGIDRRAYLALAKQWIWHSLGLLRPDLLIVDTFPRGSFGELLSALDLCRRKAFIYRPMKASFANRPDFQAMLPLYDSIVIPASRAEAEWMPVPEGARGRVLHAGPVMARERDELFSRAEARARLGVGDGALLVYVSAGGGGDPTAERQLHLVCEALAPDAGVHLVVGAGPLYRGRPIAGPRVTVLVGGSAAEHMNGFDVAIAAAGYNTFCELMHAGVPSIFLPQEKAADEQHARAERAVAVGAAIRLGDDGAAAIRDGLAGYREEGAREAAAKAARALVPENHACEVAAELLRLVLPAAGVDAVEEAFGAMAVSAQEGKEAEEAKGADRRRSTAG